MLDKNVKHQRRRACFLFRSATGYFCPASSTSATAFACAPGQLCLSGASRPQNCTAGTFCATPAAQSLCTAGSYCSTAGLSAPDGVSLPGYYSPTGAVHMTPSPTGAYCAAAGMSECPSCNPGYYCNATALTAPVGLCLTGFYCPSGAVQRSGHGPCAPGYHCPIGADRVSCGAGFYCPNAGMSTETRGGSCTPGFYCPSGSSVATGAGPCSASYYCPIGSSASSGAGLCSAGFYCTQGSSSATQAQCAAGSYCLLGSAVATGHGLCAPGFACLVCVYALGFW